MQSHASCYIVVYNVVFFALIKCARASFQISVTAKHCIRLRQFILQAGPNAILYGYIAVC